MFHHIFVFWRFVETTAKCVNPKVFRQHAFERSFQGRRKRYQHTVTESLPIVGESYGRGSNFRRFSRLSNITNAISFLSCDLWCQTVSYLCKLALCNSLNRNDSDIVSTTAISKCVLLRLRTMFAYASICSRLFRPIRKVYDDRSNFRLFFAPPETFIFFLIHAQMFPEDQSFTEN